MATEEETIQLELMRQLEELNSLSVALPTKAQAATRAREDAEMTLLQTALPPEAASDMSLEDLQRQLDELNSLSTKVQTAASHTRVHDPYDDYADYPGGGAVAGASEIQSSGSVGGLFMSENDREKVYAELKRLLDRREVLREKLRILEEREQLKSKLRELELEKEIENELRTQENGAPERKSRTSKRGTRQLSSPKDDAYEDDSDDREHQGPVVECDIGFSVRDIGPHTHTRLAEKLFDVDGGSDQVNSTRISSEPSVSKKTSSAATTAWSAYNSPASRAGDSPKVNLIPTATRTALNTPSGAYDDYLTSGSAPAGEALESEVNALARQLAELDSLTANGSPADVPKTKVPTAPKEEADAAVKVDDLMAQIAMLDSLVSPEK